jgi:hypothetical protein
MSNHEITESAHVSGALCWKCEEHLKRIHWVDGFEEFRGTTMRKFCDTHCPHCAVEPTEPMQPIGKTIAGEQGKLL